MPTKILGQAGTSLADQYDVEGSIAGLEELDSEEVKVVHEMGGTLFSERLSGSVNSGSTGAILQNIQFDVGVSFSQVTRILGIQVVSTDPARILRAQVSISSPAAFDDTDLPVWFWDVGTDGFRTANVRIAGALQTVQIMVPAITPLLPSLLTGQGSPRGVFTLNLRGRTSGFGAGNVTTQMLIYAAFPQVAGLSSKGLPVPSW